MNIETKIQQFLARYPNKVFRVNEIARRLSLTSQSEITLLKETLKNMINTNNVKQYSRKNYGHKKSTHPDIVGKFERLKNGFGIVTPFNKIRAHVIIPPQFSETAMDGDIVSVNIFSFSHLKKKNDNEFSDAPEGEVVEIIKRSEKKYIGKLEKTKHFFTIIPDSRSIEKNVYIPKDKTLGGKPGSKVVFVIDEWKSKDVNPEGSVIENLGKSGDVHAELSSVIHLYDLPLEFPKQVLQEAEKIDDEIGDKEIESRLDLRDELCFTIDPEDAKDFDDAISLKQICGNLMELGIHIADVSHYVKHNNRIDIEARKRGTSVYLADQVVPMLPESLSNNICSLIENADRLTYSVIIHIGQDGVVKNFRIVKSIIKNKKRFSYEEAHKVIDKGKGIYADILVEMYRLSYALYKNRIKLGSIDFNTSEVKFKYDKHGYPIEIIKKTRLNSHHLVEEFMLLANKLVAEQIGKVRKKGLLTPFIYRIHDKPDKEKLIELGNFISQFGYTLPLNDGVNTKSLQKLLENIKGTEEEEIINDIAIRSMAKAIYSKENIGHFGLGFKYYTHFTSPIRRYPDLIVHRLLEEYLDNKDNKNQDLANNLSFICENSSAKERNAMEAERHSTKIMQVEYMKRHVGDVFNAVISGVMKYGLFVEIIDYLVEGLVRVRDLEDDYYIYDEKNYTFKGKHTHKRYRLGDKVKVKVIRVDTKECEIDFRILN